MPTRSVKDADGVDVYINYARGAGTSGDPYEGMVISAKTDVISVTPTITAAGAYAVGDAVGGLLTFTDAALISGGTGVIQSLVITEETAATGTGHQDAAMELVLFNQSMSATTDNSVFWPSDADMLNCIGVIPLSTYYDFYANSMGVATGIGLAFKCVGSANLYGQLVTRGTPTYVATDDLTIKLGILQD